MGSEVPSLELWPKLRRRIKECKTRKAKSKLQSYASQGLEKVSLVYAELQARRDSVVERIGSPVRSMSRSRSPREEVVVESVPSADVFFDSSAEDVTIVGDAEEPVAFEESVRGVEMVLQGEVYGFGGLERRKSARARRRSLCGRERRWRQVNVTTFVVILGIVAEKSANVAGSILAALLVGLASPCRRGKQHLCHLLHDIVKHLQGQQKRIEEESPLGRRLEPPVIASPVRFGESTLESSVITSPLPRTRLESPVIASPVSYRESTLEPPVITSPVTPLPRFLESPVFSHSSPSFVERSCLSPTSNKLNQLKSKMLKSFSARDSFRGQRASSMPPSVSTAQFEDAECDLGSQSERWSPEDSLLSPARSVSPPHRVTKKKSFLQRRSALHEEENIRCSSSFGRSRFGSLRISISHADQEEFGTTASPRSLRIGSLRISTSMKESPRRSVDFFKRPPCSSPAASLRTPSAHHDPKRRHKHEVYVAVIFLVALLFLIVGRAAAVLATSASLMFLSQLDKFQQSGGGAGWDADVSRRTMSISRKLRTSEVSFLSPRSSASPRTPAAATPTTMANECRRSICMGQFFGRSKQP